MLENAWIIPALTFMSFWLILFFGKRLPKHGSEIGVGVLAVAFALSCVGVFQWLDQPEDHVVEPAGVHATDESQAGDDHALAAPVVLAGLDGTEVTAAEDDDHGGPTTIRGAVERNVTWFEIGDVEVKVGTAIDGLAVTMLFVVTLISLLVHVFSTNYMHGDPRFTFYFAGLSLFTTGMLLLVVSSSMLQLLFGWELMGLCSFMLIGHWWEEKDNSNAALKAFLTTRTGDIGLLVGISILFFAAGLTFDIASINAAALGGEIAETALLVAAVALFVAAIGKSAQFPLHTWLPDAMAGPTPVSALIHAATMVVAGVYLVARLYGVFWQAFDIGGGGVNPIAVIGGITILIAAALAFVQTDIKKVLAYSTVSQLGFMVLALGVGAWTAAIFHLFTHAFFKGLLFLGAGSVSHAVHSFDMREMGGLRKHMPTTYVTFMIGSLALAGLPPLAGFWSKDEILLGASDNGYGVFMIVGLVGAFMTAAYMTRAVYLTFFGEFRGHGHPHESPKVITVPLIVLAVLSVGAGLLNAPPLGIQAFFYATRNEVFVLAGVNHPEFSVPIAFNSIVVAVVGIAVAAVLYFGGRLPQGVTARNRAAAVGYRFLENKYYLDHLYTGVVVGSVKGSIARAANWFNQRVLDGIVNGVANGSVTSGRWIYKRIDQGVVDGAVNGAGIGAGRAGGGLRAIQNGKVQSYAALLFAGAAAFAFVLVLFVQ
ncbi:MAG TPA: NADH-quinone oxidoreductase subunit L [Acidimicrobiales bacterium]|nr:NADH-quinone oxidoreductase subunit L [Acidimicrobiales bacterium]